MFKTREEWLEAAVKEIRPRFKDYKLPDKLHIITSFPSLKSKHNVIGVCHHPNWTEDKSIYITISPDRGKGDEASILETIIHEMIHAVNFTEHPKEKAGHGSKFSKIAKKMGLVEPWTATTASKELQVELEALAKKLGEYPHTAMKQPARRNKHFVNGGSVRLVDLSIPGYKCYMFKSWLKEHGAPLSPNTKKPLTLEDGSPVEDLFEDEEGE